MPEFPIKPEYIYMEVLVRRIIYQDEEGNLRVFERIEEILKKPLP